jgi:hypothetical protein
MGGCVSGCAHYLEKSAANFRNASIHRLSSWLVTSANFALMEFSKVRLSRVLCSWKGLSLRADEFFFDPPT